MKKLYSFIYKKHIFGYKKKKKKKMYLDLIFIIAVLFFVIRWFITGILFFI